MLSTQTYYYNNNTPGWTQMGGSSPGVGGITDGDAQKDSGKTGILLAAPEYFVSDRDLNSSDRATCKWCIFELIEIQTHATHKNVNTPDLYFF